MNIKRLIIAFALLFVSIQMSIAQIAVSVTLPEALGIVQQKFTQKEVDYYLIKDENNSVWTIFVDAQPMADWTHDCYTATVPKMRDNATSVLSIEPQMTPLSMPPAGNYQALYLTKRNETALTA